MLQFTHPTLSLPSPSKLRASVSVKRNTAVCTPPKRLYSLHWSPRSGFPSAMHSAATTSSLVTVSLKSITSSLWWPQRMWAMCYPSLLFCIRSSGGEGATFFSPFVSFLGVSPTDAERGLRKIPPLSLSRNTRTDGTRSK